MSDLDSTALYPAPEGYVVDFDNPQRRADVATYWCFGIGVALSIVFTAQRVYVKLGLGTGWTLDDCELYFDFDEDFPASALPFVALPGRGCDVLLLLATILIKCF